MLKSWPLLRQCKQSYYNSFTFHWQCSLKDHTTKRVYHLSVSYVYVYYSADQQVNNLIFCWCQTREMILKKVSKHWSLTRGYHVLLLFQIGDLTYDASKQTTTVNPGQRFAEFSIPLFQKLTQPIAVFNMRLFVPETAQAKGVILTQQSVAIGALVN